jgi:hypothetical protein
MSMAKRKKKKKRENRQKKTPPRKIESQDDLAHEI